ncbi:type IV secretory system conjugative DNA transfer family protein, partial [Alicyclobacillus sendaiensis PA2]
GNQVMRRIFGQAEFSLQIRKWMDEGHIVLFDLLNVDPKDVSIIAGQILTQYYVTAKQREPDVSLPHILMIDEAHLVQIPILAKVMAETRKFGLSLGLITQYPKQFVPEILNSIQENAGTLMSCTVGPESAAQMSAVMRKQFSPETLQGLVAREVCVYTQVNNREYAFKVKCDPPVMYLPDGRVANYQDREEMRAAQQWARAKAEELQRRDCRHKDEVDREIAEYLDWLRSFREVETDEGEGESKRRPSVRKKYEPTDDELPVLEALVALVEEEGRWEGRTSALLDALGEQGIDVEEWSPKEFGKLLKRAETWLEQNGVKSNSRREETGTVWRLERA